MKQGKIETKIDDDYVWFLERIVGKVKEYTKGDDPTPSEELWDCLNKLIKEFELQYGEL